MALYRRDIVALRVLGVDSSVPVASMNAICGACVRVLLAFSGKVAVQHKGKRAFGRKIFVHVSLLSIWVGGGGQEALAAGCT